MTRREMLVGLGGILATGTCPAVLNNVPLCLVGNLEVDKMETVVCNTACTTVEDIGNWVATLNLGGRCVLVPKNWDDSVYRNCVCIFVSTGGVVWSTANTQAGQGAGFDWRAVSSYQSYISAGTEFYVLRPAQ